MMALSFVSDEQEWWYNSRRLLRAMGYTPSEVQDEVLRCKNRIILLSGGEQAGKSMVASMYLLTRMPYGELYWMVGDDYEQNHKEFTYVVDGLAQVNAVRERDISMPKRGAWQLKALGGAVQIVTKTADDIRKLAKEAPDGILINMARGSVVDEAALIKALQDGTILSAGLDVYAREPEVPAELIAMDHVVLFPHLGSSTEVTRAAMDQLLVDNLLAWAAGKPPLTPLVETPYPPKR